MLKTKHNPWLVFKDQKDHDQLTKIFCFHPAGGTSSIFQPWNKETQGLFSIISVLLPGREYRFKEQPINNVKQLIELMGQSICNVMKGNFVFFGHSYGALVAFEFARWLRRHNLPLPKHIFIAGRGAPQIKKRFKPVYNLPDDELIKVLRIYGGTNEAMLKDMNLMNIFLPAIRADLQANDTYQYYQEDPLNIDITTLVGSDDPVCNLEEINAWQALTQSKFYNQVFPGGHYFLKKNITSIIQLIQSQLRLSSDLVYQNKAAKSGT